MREKASTRSHCWPGRLSSGSRIRRILPWLLVLMPLSIGIQGMAELP
jgi:hypothetical protein